MKKFIIFAISFFIFEAARAADIHFNVDGFLGSWGIDFLVTYSGNQTLDLSVGNHTFSLSGGGSITFTVNIDDTVTSNDLDVMTHSGSTLTLNNVDIDVNAGDLSQVYMINLSGFYSGSRSFRVPVGITATIHSPPYEVVGTFNIDPITGDVTVLTGADALEGDSYALNFKYVPITVSPQNYPGVYTFYGKGYLTDQTVQYFFPNIDMPILDLLGGVLGSIPTNATGVDTYHNTHIKTEGNTVLLYQSSYTITPPLGYTAAYGIQYNYGSLSGVQDVWLLRGGPIVLWVNGNIYTETVPDDCTPFDIVTPEGTFDLSCNNDQSIYSGPLIESGFNDINVGFIAKRYDGRFSTDFNDFELFVNSQPISFVNSTINNDTLHVPDGFQEGRNFVLLRGKDEDNNSTENSYEFWAGSAEVVVTTHGATDTVTLTVVQFLNGNRYEKTVIQEAVAHTTTFENVPRIANGTVYVSTTRSKKEFKGMLSKRAEIKLLQSNK